MDVIELRRMVMAQMAQGIQGANYAKGSFTTGTRSTHKLEFGKTFSKYLYWIEMTDASKTQLMNSGQTAAKMYSCFGMYPPAEFDSSHSANDNYFSCRINPSNSNIDYSTSTAAQDIDETSITFGNAAAFTGGANSLYRTQSYNFYVVEIN